MELDHSVKLPENMKGEEVLMLSPIPYDICHQTIKEMNLIKNIRPLSGRILTLLNKY